MNEGQYKIMKCFNPLCHFFVTCFVSLFYTSCVNLVVDILLPQGQRLDMPGTFVVHSKYSTNRKRTNEKGTVYLVVLKPS